MELAHDSPETMTHVSRKEPIICLSLNIVKSGSGRDCAVFKSHRQLCVWVASKQTPHKEVTHTNTATSPLKERFPLQGKQNLRNNSSNLAAIHSPGDRAKPPAHGQWGCWTHHGGHRPNADTHPLQGAQQPGEPPTHRTVAPHTWQEHGDCSWKDGWAMPKGEQGVN